MCHKFAVLVALLVLLVSGCGGDKLSDSGTNAKSKQFPSSQLEIGKSYEFTLKEKKQRSVGGREQPATMIENNVRVNGKLIEINAQNGWLKIEGGKFEGGKIEFVHFTDVERFAELVAKSPQPSMSPTNGSSAPK